jgi:transposase
MARKTPRVRRTFTPQFKKDAVAVVEAGRSVNAVAHDLGIARSLLQRWRTQLRREPEAAFPGSGHLAPPAEQVRQLQQRLRAVTEERDILKKPWPTSRTTRSEVPLHRRASGRVPGAASLSRAGGSPPAASTPGSAGRCPTTPSGTTPSSSISERPTRRVGGPTGATHFTRSAGPMGFGRAGIASHG